MALREILKKPIVKAKLERFFLCCVSDRSWPSTVHLALHFTQNGIAHFNNSTAFALHVYPLATREFSLGKLSAERGRGRESEREMGGGGGGGRRGDEGGGLEVLYSHEARLGHMVGPFF